MKGPLILSIDTSCDETSVAVTKGRRVLSHIEYSQVLIHKKWGGVVPSLAKRAHEDKIEWTIKETLKRVKLSVDDLSSFDAIAVTVGPGLAIALEVGIRYAKKLAQRYGVKIIAVNHLEGHIYSAFVQNSKGNPQRKFEFPYLALIVSGGHTEFVVLRNHLKYERLSTTLDDAAGEALDKAAKMLGLGYPGGPVLERLSNMVDNDDRHKLPRPLTRNRTLDFSFSGLKTSFLYMLKKKTQEDIVKNINFLASSFQEAVFDTLTIKLQWAMETTKIKRLVIGGGVSSNMYLRKKIRNLVRRSKGGKVLFPSFKYLCMDNAAMIGVVGSYKYRDGDFVEDISSLDRKPRLDL